MSIITVVSDRDKASQLFGDPYASKKKATDAATKNEFAAAVDDEQKTLLEMVATGKIPIKGRDPSLLFNSPGFTGVLPAFLNDARHTVLGWLGNGSDGSVEGQILKSLVQDPLPVSNILETRLLLKGDSTKRSAEAMGSATSLFDLKQQAQNSVNQLEKTLLESRSSGSSDGEVAAIVKRLSTQQNILSSIAQSIAEGNVSTTDKNLIFKCDTSGSSSAGVLSGIGLTSMGKKSPIPGSGSGGGGGGGSPANSALLDVKGTGAGPDGGTTVWWDAGGPGPGILSGVYDDIIVEDVEPKLKHAYMAEFPGKMGVLKWLIKSIDRPKIDVEYVEQMRNNVKRNYPVKYNFGDLSITFWDDVKHVTITTIEDYFHGNVWQHPIKQLPGQFLLRDSVVIPEFKIHDYVMETKKPLTYTFYNAALASFDFDGHDDLDDGGVHTVQVVLKIEGFKVKKG